MCPCHTKRKNTRELCYIHAQRWVKSMGLEYLTYPKHQSCQCSEPRDVVSSDNGETCRQGLGGSRFDLGSRDGRADILRSPFYGASVSCRTTSWYDNDHIIIVIQWPSYSCVPCIEHGSSTRALRRLHFPQSSESEGLHAQLSLCPLRKYPRLYSMAVTSS